ncbi:MAG: hypothetical protein HY675_25510 [Chloroflexi bacterium]|nr:hypothetical protein [Chloroflexota bacterium]
MDDLWEFNKDNSEFVKVTPANSPPSARHSYAATTYNGKLYIFGGVGANGSVLNDAWSYDPATRAWTQLSQQGQLPEARYQHTAVSIGDFIYIFGGFTQGGGLTLDYAYRFDPLTGTWLERGSAFASRAGHSAVVYNDKMYIWGGQTYGNVLFNSMRMYDPQTNSWPTVSQLSGTLPVSRTLQSTASADDKIYIFQGRSAGNPEFGDAFMCSLFDYLCVQMAAVYGAQQGAAAAYQDGTGGSQASAAAVTRTRILLFGGLRDGQALSTQLIYDPLFSQRLYLPVMMRNPP